MAPTTDRQAFRETVALVAEKAKARLPQAVNGRIESAVKLVLTGDVFFHADGTVEVGSASDPLKTYILAGHACDCQDFAYGKAPDGWCQHRIAAGIQKRVQELLAQTPAQVVEVPVEAWPDNDPEGPLTDTPARPAPPAADVQAPREALPEAPASVNVRLMIAGRDCQLTLRDSDETRLLARLAAVLAQYPLPQVTGENLRSSASTQGPNQLSPQQHNAAAMHRPVRGFYPVHNVQMKENEKDGRRWFSHQVDGHWCKGRG
jgi:hypothetical protein